MGLLGLLSLLHSAFFGDQVGHWGPCRGGKGPALGAAGEFRLWGLWSRRQGAYRHAHAGFRGLGVSRSRRGDRC